MKALVVDDELFISEYLAQKLYSLKYDEVMQAADGEEGWELYAAGRPFEVVILDLILPKLDGIKLAKRILNEDRTQRIFSHFKRV